MNSKWKTSVSELVLIFRGALSAIIPWVEKAKIKWREGEAYDDWDNIAESLYENIVCASLAGEILTEYPIAKYNCSYGDYSVKDFIGIKCKSNPERRFAFIAFQSEHSPLDSVKVAELSDDERVIGYLNLDYNELEFSYVRKKKGERVVTEQIEVSI